MVIENNAAEAKDKIERAAPEPAKPGFLSRTFTLGESLGWWSVTLLLAVMGAHFFRAGQYGIMLCVAGTILFHFSASAWKRSAIGLFLLWGALEWLDTSRILAQTRMQFGMPWVRGAGILALMSALTALGGFYALARGRCLKKSVSEPALFQAAIFILIFLALFFIRLQTPVTLLLLERFWPQFGAVQIFFAAWYGAWVAGKLIDRRFSRKIRRRVWLIFCAVFFGQFALGLLGAELLLMTGKLHVPVPGFIIYAPAFRGGAGMMPFMAALAVLLAGGAWCSLLCYFGGFDSLAAGGKPVKPASPRLKSALRHGRLAVLAAGLTVAVGMRMAGVGMEVAVGAAVGFAVLSLTVMLAVSARYGGMAHCTAFCPFGLLVNLVSRLSPWRMRVSGGCDHCGVCEKVCLYRAIDRPSRERGGTGLGCTHCLDCAAACPRRAVRLHCRILPAGLNEKLAQPLFIGLIVILHVIFLMTARV